MVSFVVGSWVECARPYLPFFRRSTFPLKIRALSVMAGDDMKKPLLLPARTVSLRRRIVVNGACEYIIDANVVIKLIDE